MMEVKMAREQASSRNPAGLLETRPRPRRLGGLGAVALVLVVLLGAAAPAFGNPCGKKAAGNGRQATCDGNRASSADDGPDGTGGGSGSGSGKGNGKPKGHNGGGNDSSGNNGGGNDSSGNNGGGTGSPGRGGTKSGRHGRDRRGPDDDGGRSGSATRGRRAGDAASSHPSRLTNALSSPGSETASRPRSAAFATVADWRLAGPEHTSANLDDVRELADGTGVRLWSTALTSAETLAFPASLSLIVVLFLIAQAYIDRNDPKLKQASLRREVHEFS